MKKCPFCGGTGVLRDNGLENLKDNSESKWVIEVLIEQGWNEIYS